MSAPADSPANEPKTLFNHLVPGRQCGDCVACCHILKIDTPELQKPAGVLCPHLSGKGCGIYEQRPAQCRSWFCLWRRIEVMPDALRPDRCGVVFSLGQKLPASEPFERLFIAARAINSWQDFDHPMVRAALDMFVRAGSLPVYCSFGGTKKLFFPRWEIAKFVIDPAQPPAHLAPEVARWRAQYPSDPPASPG